MWIDQPGVGKPVVSVEFGGTPEEYLKNHRFPMLLFSMGDFTLDILVKLGIFSRFFVNSWLVQALAEARSCRSTAGRKGSTGGKSGYDDATEGRFGHAT